MAESLVAATIPRKKKMMTIPDSTTLAVIDVETSGPDPFSHQLLAIALVPFSQELEPLEIFVRPDKVHWSEIGHRYFRHYEESWNQLAVSPHVACRRLSTYLEALPSEMKLVGHNVGFDFSFLKQLLSYLDSGWFPNLSHRSVDTHSLLQMLSWLGLIPASACSSDGALDYFGISVSPRHRHTAFGDAEATQRLTLAIFAKFKSSSL